MVELGTFACPISYVKLETFQKIKFALIFHLGLNRLLPVIVFFPRTIINLIVSHIEMQSKTESNRVLA